MGSDAESAVTFSFDVAAARPTPPRALPKKSTGLANCPQCGSRKVKAFRGLPSASADGCDQLHPSSCCRSRDAAAHDNDDTFTSVALPHVHEIPILVRALSA